jgi:hypothetical protein
MNVSISDENIFMQKTIWVDESNFDDLQIFNLKYTILNVRNDKKSSYKKRKNNIDEPLNKIGLQKVIHIN